MISVFNARITGFQKEKYHIVHIAGGGVEAASDRFLDSQALTTSLTSSERSSVRRVSNRSRLSGGTVSRQFSGMMGKSS